jgi:hypothetical protein
MGTPDPLVKPVAQTRIQLARSYGIHPETLKRWLAPFSKDIGPINGNLLTPKQVKIIYERLGTP